MSENTLQKLRLLEAKLENNLLCLREIMSQLTLEEENSRQRTNRHSRSSRGDVDARSDRSDRSDRKVPMKRSGSKAPRARYRKVPCKNGTDCTFGAKCTYLHSEEELAFFSSRNNDDISQEDVE